MQTFYAANTNISIKVPLELINNYIKYIVNKRNCCFVNDIIACVTPAVGRRGGDGCKRANDFIVLQMKKICS